MAAPRVELQTSMGSFAVELYTRQAPKTCKNFVELARKGYYDGTIVSSWGTACWKCSPGGWLSSCLAPAGALTLLLWNDAPGSAWCLLQDACKLLGRCGTWDCVMLVSVCLSAVGAVQPANNRTSLESSSVWIPKVKACVI